MIVDPNAPAPTLRRTEIVPDTHEPGSFLIYKRLSDDTARVMAAIKFQEGPIGTAGINGCQVDDLLALCRDRLLSFLPEDATMNIAKSPEPFTLRALSMVKLALLALEGRTLDRTERGVEGTAQP